MKHATADLSAALVTPLRDLIIMLADTKRLLGIRYSDWILAAPSLESGIAAASMAQDEWGHARLTYALVTDLGGDPEWLEHSRGAEQYHAPEVLDSGLATWAELIAAALLLDTALTVQYGALVESGYTPARNRVEKLLDEETFHFQYAVAWTERMAASGAREQFEEAAKRLLPISVRWLRGADTAHYETLQAAGIVRERGAALQARYLQLVGPVLEAAGLAVDFGLTSQADGWRYEDDLPREGWDPTRRRAASGGPDADTLARVRGDRNRAVLLDG